MDDVWASLHAFIGTCKECGREDTLVHADDERCLRCWNKK